MATYATQSVTVPQVLDAVALLARKALGWPAQRVIEWHYTGRPNLDQGRSVVWYKLIDRNPDHDSGAGRHGIKSPMQMQINLTTRGFYDQAEKDRRLGRDHWANQFLLENAFLGRLLHDAYDDRVGDEPPMPSDGALIISMAGTMVTSKIPAPEKPRPEQGYIETAITLEIPCILKLSLNDIPEA